MEEITKNHPFEFFFPVLLKGEKKFCAECPFVNLISFFSLQTNYDCVCRSPDPATFSRVKCASFRFYFSFDMMRLVVIVLAFFCCGLVTSRPYPSSENEWTLSYTPIKCFNDPFSNSDAPVFGSGFDASLDVSCVFQFPSNILFLFFPLGDLLLMISINFRGSISINLSNCCVSDGVVLSSS